MDYKLVAVKWIDSTQCDGWILKEDLKELDMHIESCAFLIHETENFIVLASHAGNDCICSAMQIPRVAILSIEEINYAAS